VAPRVASAPVGYPCTRLAIVGEQLPMRRLAHTCMQIARCFVFAARQEQRGFSVVVAGGLTLLALSPLAIRDCLLREQRRSAKASACKRCTACIKYPVRARDAASDMAHSTCHSPRFGGRAGDADGRVRLPYYPTAYRRVCAAMRSRIGLME